MASGSSHPATVSSEALRAHAVAETLRAMRDDPAFEERCAGIANDDALTDVVAVELCRRLASQQSQPSESPEEAPRFTERQVDLCLDAAALLRRSYGMPLAPDPYDNDECREAVEWDELAASIARLAGVELERECGECVEGKHLGHTCLVCAGTSLLPPRLNGGAEVRP